MGALKIILCLLILIFLVVKGQTSETEMTTAEPLVLTVEDAVERALTNNLELRAKQYEATASKWGQVEAWSNWLPHVQFATDYIRLDEETVLRSNSFLNLFPIFEEIFPGFSYDPNELPQAAYEGSYLSSVSVTQAIYNGGAEWGGIRIAAAMRRLAENSLENTRQELILNTHQAYYDILKAQEYHALITQSLELASQNLTSARRKADLGMLARSDVLRWEVMVADLDIQLIEAQNALELADLSLKNILMIPPERKVIVTPITDDERIRLYEEISMKSVELVGTDQSIVSQSHPGLSMATNLMEAESANLWSATSGFQPQVNFTWSYSWEQDDDLDLDGFTSWAAILSVRIPLFSGFGNVARVQQARWRLRKSKLDLRNTEQNLQLVSRSTRLKLQSAAKRVRSAQKVLEEADENLDIMQNRYDVGLVSNLQLIDAQVSHREANLNLINALYDYLLAKVETAKAQGILTR